MRKINKVEQKKMLKRVDRSKKKRAEGHSSIIMRPTRRNKPTSSDMAGSWKSVTQPSTVTPQHWVGFVQQVICVVSDEAGFPAF